MGCDVLVRAARQCRSPWPSVRRRCNVCGRFARGCFCCVARWEVQLLCPFPKPRTDVFPSVSEEGSTPHASRYQLFTSIRHSDDISKCPQCISSSVSSSSRTTYRFFFRIQVMSFVKVHIPDHRPSSSSISSTMTAARSDFENFACPSSRVMHQCCV